MMWQNKISDPEQLSQIAYQVRKSILISLTTAGSGHLGGSLGLAEVFTVLYFNILNHHCDFPQHPDRDKLVLSAGHLAPVLYATLSEAGYFPKEELNSLRKLGSRLQGHPGRDHGLPGLELSAGSLGQGLSVAVGMALADKLDQKNRRIFCILGDGENQEGSVWEAAMSAAHHNLKHLCAIVDRNNLQIDGPTESVMQLEPLASKWAAFGWEVKECDGNSIESVAACLQAVDHPAKPVVVIAHTVMGKGVPSIENNNQWHGAVPSDAQLIQFLHELEDRL